MKNQTQVSFKPINDLVEHFNQTMEEFTKNDYQYAQELIATIQSEIENIFSISEQRYMQRIIDRDVRNKAILEENYIAAKNAVPNFISENPEKFLFLLKKKGITIDEHGGLHTNPHKIKHSTYIPDFIETNFIKKPTVDSDHYSEVQSDLKEKSKQFINELITTLEQTYKNNKSIYEAYTSLEDLFNEIGLSTQTRDFDLFKKATIISKDQNTPHVTNGKETSPAPDFKKVGWIMQHLFNKNIIINPRHIIIYPDNCVYLYIASKNISILVSDVLSENNCFRDATYIINGPILENNSIDRATLSDYQGKRIIFNDNWTNRIENSLDENSSSRPTIANTPEEIDTNLPKQFIQNKEDFIHIIKENFDYTNLTMDGYAAFTEAYNNNPNNKYTLRSNLTSNSILLGLQANTPIGDIKKSIWGMTINKENKTHLNFMGNSEILTQLKLIKTDTSFNPDMHLGYTSYMHWVNKILKQSFGIDDIESIKNTYSRQEQKEMLRKKWKIDIPLHAQTLSTYLGGVSCTTEFYQKLLRKRFCLYIENKTDSSDYQNISQQIDFHETLYIAASKPRTQYIKKNVK